MILRIDHVQLAMPEGGEAAARAFYEGVLGLSEVEKPEGLRGRGGCWFEGGPPGAPVRVHLGVEAGFRPARKAHPCFVVADIDAFSVRCAERGVSFLRDEAVAGVMRGFLEDPFGNRIEVMAG
ncbi:MAG: VOC family protein [Pseudomonadota bacterium]